MEISAPDIEEYHDLLRGRLHDALGIEAELPATREDWQYAMVGTAFSFELRTLKEEHRAYYRPDKGHPAWVTLPVAIEDGEMAVGVGWHEEWKASNDDRFAVQQLGWSFYWGDYYSQNRLFRAEWAPSQEPQSRYGQPHWHFDRKLVAEFFGSGDDNSAIQDIGFKRLHLPMAAWDNTDFDMNCWRRNIAAVPMLLDWAMKTLDYGMSELERLGKGDLVY
ncbi:MAG: hypothetical protein KKI08_14035 [Armatimonadetes bacterium]|nr:hypothetical protein [Armatimonadota bacterium]